MIGLDQVSPRIGSQSLYPGITIDVANGEILAVMGKSGVGKSLLLDCISGSYHDHFGKISKGAKVFRVYQDHDQLFPWMTIRENMSIAGCHDTALSICQRWNLDKYWDSKPHQLSVGQRQRMTLIRALGRPELILLCDEPLSAVDGLTALDLAKEFRELAHESNKCVIWITHDILEAKSVADRYLVLSVDGHVVLSPNVTADEILSKIS